MGNNYLNTRCLIGKLSCIFSILLKSESISLQPDMQLVMEDPMRIIVIILLCFSMFYYMVNIQYWSECIIKGDYVEKYFSIIRQLFFFMHLDIPKNFHISWKLTMKIFLKFKKKKKKTFQKLLAFDFYYICILFHSVYSAFNIYS